MKMRRNVNFVGWEIETTIKEIYHTPRLIFLFIPPRALVTQRVVIINGAAFHCSTAITASTCERRDSVETLREGTDSYEWISLIRTKFNTRQFNVCRTFVDRNTERGRDYIFVYTYKNKSHRCSYEHFQSRSCLTDNQVEPPPRTAETLRLYQRWSVFAYIYTKQQLRNSIIFSLLGCTKDRQPSWIEKPTGAGWIVSRHFLDNRNDERIENLPPARDSLVEQNSRPAAQRQQHCFEIPWHQRDSVSPLALSVL